MTNLIHEAWIRKAVMNAAQSAVVKLGECIKCRIPLRDGPRAEALMFKVCDACGTMYVQKTTTQPPAPGGDQ